MELVQAGLDFIKEQEGCSLTSYQDSGGVWTIAYGITGPNVVKGMEITQNEADAMLIMRLRPVEAVVTSLVTIELKDNEFCALVSFSYNIGLHAFGNSQLLKCVNNSDRDGIQEEFLKWNHIKGVVFLGLTRRREAELDLFLNGFPSINPVLG